jgi:hypothetical protein
MREHKYMQHLQWLSQIQATTLRNVTSIVIEGAVTVVLIAFVTSCTSGVIPFCKKTNQPRVGDQDLFGPFLNYLLNTSYHLGGPDKIMLVE